MYDGIGTVKYGMGQNQPISSDHSGAANGAVTSRHTGSLSGLDKQNPMLWLIGIGAVTLGMAGFSIHGRVGKFAASASAGD